jgi:AraC-like DNA-binding protein
MTTDSVFGVLCHKPHISPRDRLFLDNFRKVVDEHQSDPGFTTALAASSVGLSRMQLNRKLRTMTGLSTHEYILQRRLDGACGLLSRALPIAVIAESVGFKSSSHFAKVFRQKFGSPPSEYPGKAPLPREPTGWKRLEK